MANFMRESSDKPDRRFNQRRIVTDGHRTAIRHGKRPGGTLRRVRYYLHRAEDGIDAALLRNEDEEFGINVEMSRYLAEIVHGGGMPAGLRRREKRARR